MSSFSGKASVVGIGSTEFSKNSGRSEMRLTVEAVLAALADAGLRPDEVDGLSTYTMDNNFETEVFRNIGGLDLKFFSRAHYGGGASCAPLQQAAMAVATGIAEVVVFYRGLNERSEYRFGQPMGAASVNAESVLLNYTTHQGLQTPAAMFSLFVRRYMYETGAGPEDFYNIVEACRSHASTNPNAIYYGKPPPSLDEYLTSRMIADPFRLFDCCQETDGSVAIVVTSTERARDLRQKPVLIKGAAQSAPRGTVMAVNCYGDGLAPRNESELIARQVYKQAGIEPDDIDVAILYDHFAPMLLPVIEGLGFCRNGEAKDFIKDGNLKLGGKLPLNTNGGQLGEAYVHGMNGIAEAVRQIRGTAVNQVHGAQHVILTGGSGTPCSGAILGAA